MLLCFAATIAGRAPIVLVRSSIVLAVGGALLFVLSTTLLRRGASPIVGPIVGPLVLPVVLPVGSTARQHNFRKYTPGSRLHAEVFLKVLYVSGSSPLARFSFGRQPFWGGC